MPRRRPPRRLPPTTALPSLATSRVEVGPDGYDYEVRAVAGARAAKTYRCPGCDQELTQGVAHVVVWRADMGDGDDRRHWHTPCWTKRRTPTRRWS